MTLHASSDAAIHTLRYRSVGHMTSSLGTRTRMPGTGGGVWQGCEHFIHDGGWWMATCWHAHALSRAWSPQPLNRFASMQRGWASPEGRRLVASWLRVRCSQGAVATQGLDVEHRCWRQEAAPLLCSITPQQISADNEEKTPQENVTSCLQRQVCPLSAASACTNVDKGIFEKVRLCSKHKRQPITRPKSTELQK